MLGPDKVERFINALRESNPDSTYIYTRGLCFNFFLLMRTLFPQAKAFYSANEGHVWVEIDGKFYDIYGRHFMLPKDLDFINWRTTDPPHRWSPRFEFNCWQAMRIRESDKEAKEAHPLFPRCREKDPEFRKRDWRIGYDSESLDKGAELVYHT